MKFLRKYEDRPEFMSIAEEMLAVDEYLKLNDYRHHGGSILEHSLSVAAKAYRVSRSMSLDYVSCTRGALLHDFFLYDWREYKKVGNGPSHGLQHPKTALENAGKHFEVNEIEKDIILKHMWPKVLGVPQYRETHVVIWIDKIAAVAEFAEEAAENRARRSYVPYIEGI